MDKEIHGLGLQKQLDVCGGFCETENHHYGKKQTKPKNPLFSVSLGKSEMTFYAF